MEQMFTYLPGILRRSYMLHVASCESHVGSAYTMVCEDVKPQHCTGCNTSLNLPAVTQPTLPTLTMLLVVMRMMVKLVRGGGKMRGKFEMRSLGKCIFAECASNIPTHQRWIITVLIIVLLYLQQDLWCTCFA